MVQRIAACVAWVTAVALFALGMLLASIDQGRGASPVLLAVAGMAAELGMALVLLYAFSAVSAGPWAWAGRLTGVVAMGLLFAGDASQTDALRTVGNVVFYATLILLGSLMWDAHRWLGAFAAVNGLLGFVFLAFAASVGLPDELNLLLVVVWLVALGIEWFRTATQPAVAESRPAHVT